MTETIGLQLMSDNASVSCSGPRDDQWLISIMERMEDDENNQLDGPKVPTMLRKIEENKGCYDPTVVSIGPYHHGKSGLEEMQMLKAKFALQFVRDSRKHYQEVFSNVKVVISSARTFYDRKSIEEIDDEQFAQMMFLDGCFILHFIYYFLNKPQDLKLSSHDAAFVIRDLFLLENQLPYKVLKSLMVFMGDGGKVDQLFETFFQYVRAIQPRREFKKELTNKLIDKLPRTISGRLDVPPATEKDPPRHLLEWFHTQFVGSGHNHATSSHQNEKKISWYRYYPAQELRYVGIHFKPSRTSLYSDVQFKRRLLLGGRLYVPPLRLDDTTKSLLLNLVAYEACHGTSNQWVTSYVCFMDSLIDDPEDVKVLRSQGVLVNTLGSDEKVANLFNDIAIHLIPNPSAFNEVKLSIEVERRKVVRKWIAMWLRTYFSSPWTFIAFIAATFTIILTAIQTFIAVFPPKNRK